MKDSHRNLLILIIIIGIAIIVAGGLYLYSPKDTQKEATHSETESPAPDSQLPSGFAIHGSAEQAPAFEGKTYYFLTKNHAYVIANAEFSGAGGDRHISGGDAYVIENADLATFSTLRSFTDENLVAKDKHHVYFQGKIVRDAQPAAFDLGTDFATCEYTDGSKCFNLTANSR